MAKKKTQSTWYERPLLINYLVEGEEKTHLNFRSVVNCLKLDPPKEKINHETFYMGTNWRKSMKNFATNFLQQTNNEQKMKHPLKAIFKFCIVNFCILSFLWSLFWKHCDGRIKFNAAKRSAIGICITLRLCKFKSNAVKQGFPTWGTRPPGWDARGFKVVFTWVYLYQWGDEIDVRGDADTKRMGTL